MTTKPKRTSVLTFRLQKRHWPKSTGNRHELAQSRDAWDAAWCQALEQAMPGTRAAVARALALHACSSAWSRHPDPDQTPYVIRASMHGHEIKERGDKAKGWKWWLARTFAAARRALAVDLQVAGRADAKAADGVAVAVAGASARHLDEVLPPAHPAHLPQLLLAEQPRAGSSVHRGHVSGQEQDKAQKSDGKNGHRLIWVASKQETTECREVESTNWWIEVKES